MFNLKDLKLKYIIDKKGKKREVIISVQEFEKLLEDLEDLAVAAERRDEDTVSHEELVQELKKDGLL